MLASMTGTYTVHHMVNQFHLTVLDLGLNSGETMVWIWQYEWNLLVISDGLENTKESWPMFGVTSLECQNMIVKDRNDCSMLGGALYFPVVGLCRQVQSSTLYLYYHHCWSVHSFYFYFELDLVNFYPPNFSEDVKNWANLWHYLGDKAINRKFYTTQKQNLYLPIVSWGV